jgi:hypothetical protein
VLKFIYSLSCLVAGVQKDRARGRVQGGRVHRLPHEALLPMQDARFPYLSVLLLSLSAFVVQVSLSLDEQTIFFQCG